MSAGESSVESVDSVPSLRSRPREFHKGDLGRVLVVGGSSGMLGAACLAAEAALRSGAGLVTLAVPRSLQDVAATKLTSVMTVALSETPTRGFSTRALEELQDLQQGFDCIAVGPGLGRHPNTMQFAKELPRLIGCPLVLDADALFPFSEQPELLRREAPTVTTPHPGEMARLIGRSVGPDEGERRSCAASYAGSSDCIVVLKGAGTVVSDGRRTYVNRTGNPGMATGGSGDVLTGMVAGLLPQCEDAFSAAVLAVHCHGLAGDRARSRLGEIGMTAEDILADVPLALWSHVQGTDGKT